MDLLKSTSCKSHLLVLNNFCIFALNTKVTQLLNIVLKINAANAGNLVKQYSCENEGAVGT